MGQLLAANVLVGLYMQETSGEALDYDEDFEGLDDL